MYYTDAFPPPACPSSELTSGQHCFCLPRRRDAFAGTLSVSVPAPPACCFCGAERGATA